MKTRERIKQLVQEGNRRHLVVRREGRTIAELPLTIGVVGAVVAPGLAVAAGVAALVTHSNVAIEQVAPAVPASEPPAGPAVPA